MSDRELLALMTAEQAQTYAELSSAAKGGDGTAACKLGDLFREGKGLPCSPKEAFRWYARSAKAGNVDGQNKLGTSYEHGVGCRPNPCQAVKWYALSAAQHHRVAQTNLGLCYLEGYGVSKDMFEATRWLEKARTQRDPVAVAKLRELWESPESREAMSRVDPNRGGIWSESIWIKDRLGEWDCIGTDRMMSDSAQARNEELTAKYGPPTVEIITKGSQDRVKLNWSLDTSSRILLIQSSRRLEDAEPQAA